MASHTKEHIALVCKAGNELYPDLRITIADLTTPKEGFLTKVLVHYLKSFSFRIEPPFNINNEAIDNSREKRVFLVQLCRQVEYIVKISFPNRSFTYIDIIKPTSVKTVATLDILFNYRCYFKMYKRDVFKTVEDQLRQNDNLAITINAKRAELEQATQRTQHINADIATCKASITQLNDETKHRKLNEELAGLRNSIKQEEDKVEAIDQQLSQINDKMQHLQEQTVDDEKAEKLFDQVKKKRELHEQSKADLATKAKTMKERQSEIELLRDFYKSTSEVIVQCSAPKIAQHNEKLTLNKRMEKENNALEAKFKQLQAILQENKTIFESLGVDVMKENKNDETAPMKAKINELKLGIEKANNQVDNYKKKQQQLKEQFEEEREFGVQLRETLAVIFNRN